MANDNGFFFGNGNDYNTDEYIPRKKKNGKKKLPDTSTLNGYARYVSSTPWNPGYGYDDDDDDFFFDDGYVSQPLSGASVVTPPGPATPSTSTSLGVVSPEKPVGQPLTPSYPKPYTQPTQTPSWIETHDDQGEDEYDFFMEDMLGGTPYSPGLMEQSAAGTPFIPPSPTEIRTAMGEVPREPTAVELAQQAQDTQVADEWLLNPTPITPTPPTDTSGMFGPSATAGLGQATGLPITATTDPSGMFAPSATAGEVPGEIPVATGTMGEAMDFFSGLPDAAKAQVNAYLGRTNTNVLDAVNALYPNWTATTQQPSVPGPTGGLGGLVPEVKPTTPSEWFTGELPKWGDMTPEQQQVAAVADHMEGGFLVRGSGELPSNWKTMLDSRNREVYGITSEIASQFISMDRQSRIEGLQNQIDTENKAWKNKSVGADQATRDAHTGLITQLNNDIAKINNETDEQTMGLGTAADGVTAPDGVTKDSVDPAFKAALDAKDPRKATVVTKDGLLIKDPITGSSITPTAGAALTTDEFEAGMKAIEEGGDLTAIAKYIRTSATVIDGTEVEGGGIDPRSKVLIDAWYEKNDPTGQAKRDFEREIVETREYGEYDRMALQMGFEGTQQEKRLVVDVGRTLAQKQIAKDRLDFEQTQFTDEQSRNDFKQRLAENEQRAKLGMPLLDVRSKTPGALLPEAEQPRKLAVEQADNELRQQRMQENLVRAQMGMDLIDVKDGKILKVQPKTMAEREMVLAEGGLTEENRSALVREAMEERGITVREEDLDEQTRSALVREKLEQRIQTERERAAIAGETELEMTRQDRARTARAGEDIAARELTIRETLGEQQNTIERMRTAGTLSNQQAELALSRTEARAREDIERQRLGLETGALTERQRAARAGEQLQREQLQQQAARGLTAEQQIEQARLQREAQTGGRLTAQQQLQEAHRERENENRRLIAEIASQMMMQQSQQAMQNPYAFWAANQMMGDPSGAPPGMQQPFEQLGFQMPGGFAPGATMGPGQFFGGGLPTLGALSQAGPEAIQAILAPLGFAGTSPQEFARRVRGITPGTTPRGFMGAMATRRPGARGFGALARA